MKTIMQRYYPTLVSPLLLLLLFAIVFSKYQMFPFGGGSVAWCDMNQQVIPLLMDLKDVLNGKESLFLNMQNGAGMNFWGVYCFFLSSPISLLVAFVNKESLILFVNVMVVLKLMLAASSASLFFIKCREKLNGGFVIALSLMYGLCGFGMLFYQNLMWLDIMTMLPLLMIGLEKLTKTGKALYYTITLTIIAVLNYYLCYMTAVFIMLYIAVYYFSHPHSSERKTVCFRFLIGTLTAAMISSVVWLPSMIQVKGSGRVTSVLDNIIKSNFNTSYYTVLPLLFCTAILFTIITLLILSRNQKTKDERNYLILFLLSCIPLFIEPVNLLWHTGSYMSFPARYGFITVFTGLICCSDFLIKSGENLSFKKRKIQYIAIPILVIMLCTAYHYIYTYIDRNYNSLTKYTSTLWGNKDSFDGLFRLCVIAVCCYFIMYMFYRFHWLSKKTFAVMMVTACLLEGAGNIRIYMVSPALNNPSRTESFIEMSKLSEKIQDGSFYRVAADTNSADYNMSGALGYPSVSHYTSLTNYDFMKLQRQLGYSTVWMKSGGRGGTELTDVIYNIKYRITDDKSAENIIVSDNKYAIRALTISGAIAWMSDTDITDLEDVPENFTRAQVQQYIFSKFFDSDNQIIQSYQYDTSKSKGIRFSDNEFHITSGANVTFKCNILDKQTLYADCFNGFSHNLSEDWFDTLSVSVNGQTIKNSYPTSDENGLLRLGTFENEQVTVVLTAKKAFHCFSFGVFGLDLNILNTAVNNSVLPSLQYQNGIISGTVITDKTSTVLLSLPYQNGLKVTVNGCSIPCYRVLSDFTAFRLTEGENHIEIMLTPQGFIPGLIISLTGIILLIIVAVLKLKRKIIYIPKIIYTMSEVITGWCTLAAALIIYLMPIILIVTS